jgi:hypothetical protein
MKRLELPEFFGKREAKGPRGSWAQWPNKGGHLIFQKPYLMVS